MARFHDWTSGQMKQRQQGRRIMNDKERERELYVKAWDATKEAERQGDRQLRAAMEASMFRPGGSGMLLCSFPLKFNVPRLEEAYWRKCSVNSDKDYVPVACLILFCVLVPTAMFSRHWNEMVHQSMNLWASGNLSWYLFAILLCGMILVIQLGFPKCIHVYSSAVGLGLQTIAILARGSFNEAPILLLLLFVGHAVGMLIAYVLDRECRSNFLHSMPQLILEDITGSGHPEQFFQSCETPLLRQMPNLGQISSSFLNSNASGRHRFDEALCYKAIQSNAPRRALGGFAGGFGGVSGLKSSKPLFITTSSANKFSGKSGDSNTSFTDSWAYNLGALGSSSADNIVEGRLSTSIGSCSCIDSDIVLDNQFFNRVG